MDKVLVIDDDPMVCFTLSKILRNAGYDVVTAEDGRRGLTVFRAEQPRIVVIDIIMPEQDGIETMIKIKRECPEAKIIAMSGGYRTGNLDILGSTRHLGADDIIAKPFEGEELLVRLEGVNPFAASAGSI